MRCHTIDNGIECNFIVGVDHAINPHLHIRSQKFNLFN